jgi:homocysteine S-methyltransferase
MTTSNLSTGSLKQWLTSSTNRSTDTADSSAESSSLLLPSALLLDGGVSTHLEEYVRRELGMDPPFSNRSLWSSSLLLTTQGRAAIQACHEAFLHAGSDIISTVTYQCHYRCMGESVMVENEDGTMTKRSLTEGDMDQMIRDGVRLAKAAVIANKSTSSNKQETQKTAFVAASIGCYGGALADGSEYRGNYGATQETLTDFYRRKVTVLLEEKPDALAFETVPDVNECLAIVSLLQEKEFHASALPAIWLSLACKDGSHLNDGTPIVDVLDIIQKAENHGGQFILAIGVNCCSCAHGKSHGISFTVEASTSPHSAACLCHFFLFSG